MYLRVTEEQRKNMISFIANARTGQSIGSVVPVYLEILNILDHPIKDEDVIIKNQKNENKSVSSEADKPEVIPDKQS